MITTRAVLTHRQPFSNSSLLVTWLTPDQGQIKTMAKGVTRRDNPIAPLLDLYYFCEIAYVTSARSEIGTLREVKLLHPFLALRRDWNVILCAQYFAELLTALTEPRAEITELFAMFEKGLRYLETHLPTMRLIERYERKLLILSGLPVDIPQALQRGLQAHHHELPAIRARLLQVCAVIP